MFFKLVNEEDLRDALLDEEMNKKEKKRDFEKS